jgi:hypothetical protein
MEVTSLGGRWMVFETLGLGGLDCNGNGSRRVGES